MESKNFLIIETEIGRYNFAREELLCTFERASSIPVREMGQGIFIAEGIHDLNGLAFVKRAGQVLGIAEQFSDISKVLLPEGRFYVRVIDSHKCHGTSEEKEIGQLLGGIGRVSFSNPDFVVLAYHLDKWYICMQKYSRNNLEKAKRKAPLRPFFSPVSMDPAFASFLINMGYFPHGSTLLDPFCGGGGILMEAGLKGYRVEGIDILNEMVIGARMNLKYFGIREFSIIKTDFLEFQSDKKYGGIVTDFPYGRNSHISKERSEFYFRAAQKMSEFLETGSRACIVTDNMENLEYFKNFFDIDIILPQKVHKSLTRYFTRMIKK